MDMCVKLEPHELNSPDHKEVEPTLFPLFGKPDEKTTSNLLVEEVKDEYKIDIHEEPFDITFPELPKNEPKREAITALLPKMEEEDEEEWKTSVEECPRHHKRTHTETNVDVDEDLICSNTACSRNTPGNSNFCHKDGEIPIATCTAITNHNPLSGVTDGRNKHLLNTTCSKSEHKYICDHCRQRLVRKCNITKHMKVHRNNRTAAASTSITNATVSTCGTTECSYTCSVCGRIFKQKNNNRSYCTTHTHSGNHQLSKSLGARRDAPNGNEQQLPCLQHTFDPSTSKSSQCCNCDTDNGNMSKTSTSPSSSSSAVVIDEIQNLVCNVCGKVSTECYFLTIPSLKYTCNMCVACVGIISDDFLMSRIILYRALDSGTVFVGKATAKVKADIP